MDCFAGTGIQPASTPRSPIGNPCRASRICSSLFAPQPYFGRELRYFNQAPWWYKLEFPTPRQARRATLRFEGVDYFAKVWLNEKLLGSTKAMPIHSI